MKKIILIATLLVFVGCSSDENKENKKYEVKTPVTKVPITKKETIVQEKEAVTVEEKVVKAEPKKIAKATKSGKEIFQACTACHGAKADKPALGKSQIIKGWDATKVSAALNGYKDGSYGGPMKALMIGQVGFLSDDEVKSVSEYISKL